LKRKKQKRFISWLLAMLLVLNVFLPAVNVQADEPGAPAENVITISSDGDVASPSDATKPETPEEEEDGDTDVPLGTPSEGTKKDPVSASPPPVAAPLNIEPLASVLSLLTYEATVKVDGNTFQPDAEMTFPDGKDISIEFEFDPFPVSVDGGTGVVNPGDTAIINMGKGLRIPIEPLSIPLLAPGNIPVGTAVLSTNGSGEVVANISFQWDWGNQAGQVNENTPAISVGFNANLKYDESKADEEDGKKFITVLDKKFYVKEPVAPTTYEINKKDGEINWVTKTIEWEVEVTAEKSGQPVNLDGVTFSDNLTNVGEYLTGSFKVGATGGTLTGTTPDQTAPLIYNFPNNTMSPQTIKFETKIKDEDFYLNTSKTITNTAQVLKDSKVEHSDSGTATLIAKRWIIKSGKPNTPQSGEIYDPTNRTITWTIIANTAGVGLNNVKITDSIPSGLTVTSATWYKGDTSDTSEESSLWTDPQGITAVNNIYDLGNITTPVKLVIVTSVPDDSSTTESKPYNNTASITWDGLGTHGPIDSETVGIGIGYNPITKSGQRIGSNTDRNIKWTVTIDPKGQNFGSDIKVYDLLVYGGNDITGTVDGLPAGIALNNLTQRRNQKFVTGSFDATLGNPNFVTVHTLSQGGVAVADLIEFSVESDKKNTFTFNSQVVNPAVFAKNGSETVTNTASLFRGTTKLNSASANVPYNTKLLNKEILNGNEANKQGPDANNIGTAANGFDHVNKTAIFRISVNSDSLNLTGGNIDSGPVKVTDTLPSGWVFDTSFNNKGYKIIEGTGGNDSIIATSTEVTGNDPVAVFSPDPAMASEVTFTFTTLDKPYVILVKANLTEEKYKELLTANNPNTPHLNTATLRVDKWDLTKTDTQNVTVNTKVLDKKFVFNDTNATLTWTVEYNPFGLDISENMTPVFIEDTLSEGIELRINSDGKPLWQSGVQTNFTLTELTVGADGSIPANGTPVPLSDDIITYNAATRTLKFKVPDITKAYRLTYITDITLESNGPVNNSVKLTGSEVDGDATNVSHPVIYKDGWANLQKGGSVEITKVDGSSTAILPGAQFTLYNGTTVIRQGVTGSDGKLKLRAVPIGTYTLKETEAPDNYKPDVKTYQVVVREEGSTVVTSIDGGSNTITVENFQSNTVGDLTIRKTIAGNGAKIEDSFVFTVTFNVAGRYPYMGDGIPSGTIASGETISLKGGQSVTIYNIPNTATYSVTEADYSGNGYDKPAITGDGATGTIGAGKTVTFTNTKILPGSLVISKTVLGSGADKTKKFNFTVTFNAEGSYSYSGAGVPNGTIKSGDTIALADGESITIIGLAPGTTYKVTEADYTSQRYSTASTNAEGTIISDSGITAAFTNTYRRPSSGGGGGNGGGNPKPPTNPTPTPPTPTPTPEPVNPGEVPQGYLQGPDGNYYTPQQLYDIFGQIPLGFMVGPNGMLVPLGGLPKTSDDVSRSVVVFGLLSISALLGMAVSVNNLRKKHSDE